MNTLTREQAASRQFQIKSLGVLEGLPPQQLADLESLGVYLEYQDELVAADGAVLGFFFVVIAGSFEISKIDPQIKKKIVLAKLGEGECFGEMGFLTGAPAAANVMAVGKTVCWAIQHPALKQFVESNAAGNRLTINIALLLARRVQEGNTRLLGANASLSAFFGTQARASTVQHLEAPRATDHAEMEIPDEVFDSFVCEVLNVPKNQPLTDAQRDDVRHQIEANRVDIVPWLEQAGHGKQLRVRLKFVEESPAPRLAVQAPRMATPVLAQPRVVRVPQTRAQIAPAIPIVVARPRSLFWKIGNVASWAGLPIITVLIVMLLLPLDSREAIARSAGFRRLPCQGCWNALLFRTQTMPTDVNVASGLWQSLEVEMPKLSHVTGRLEFSQKSSARMSVTVKVLKKDANETPTYQQTVEIDASNGSCPLFSIPLAPGTYLFEFRGADGAPENGVPAKLIVVAKH